MPALMAHILYAGRQITGYKFNMFQIIQMPELL